MINKRMSAQALALAAPLASVLLFRVISAGPATASAQDAGEIPEATTASSRTSATQEQLDAMAWLAGRTRGQHASPFGTISPQAAPKDPPRIEDAPRIEEAPDLRVTSIMGFGDRALVVIGGRAHRIGDAVTERWRMVGVGESGRSIVLEAADGTRVTLPLDR